MTIENIIEKFCDRYPVNAQCSSRKVWEVGLNCLSLSEAWRLNSKAEGSLTLSVYDGEDLLIDSMHGNSWETIPIELMNVCLNRADKVKRVRVFSYEKGNTETKSVVVGCLDIR